MPDPADRQPPPELVTDPMLDHGRTDSETMDTVKGHQHGRADAASGGADSSPLDTAATDESAAVPPAERTDTPDQNVKRK